METQPAPANSGDPTPATAPPRAPRKGLRFLKTVLIGAAVSFASISLLYGPGQAAMLVGLAVICTAGLGLIPIVFLSWVVGWVALAVWRSVFPRPDVRSAS